MPARADCKGLKAAFAGVPFTNCCMACHQDADGLADRGPGRALLAFQYGPIVRCRGKKVQLRYSICCKVRDWLLVHHPQGARMASKLKRMKKVTDGR
jgi:hypothetical protein